MYNNAWWDLKDQAKEPAGLLTWEVEVARKLFSLPENLISEWKSGPILDYVNSKLNKITFNNNSSTFF